MEIEDLPAVFALGERLFRAPDVPILHRTWDEFEVIDFFSSDSEFCLVAERSDEIVGFVIGTIIEKRRSAWTYGYLVWLGVAPEVEGKGVAHRLVSRITDLFIAGGARMMMVDTEADNERAIDFFENEGFGSPVEHLYLSKNLRHHPGYRKPAPRKQPLKPVR
ncbi:MAG: GNAT family N-acetyltransferase [Gammaproteobacteria bacterium]|nr:GNAT family N-acetyltransferase [Gammaproteobacteria bacterium]